MRLRPPSLRKMGKFAWFRKLMIVLGIIGVIVGIWIGFPMIGVEILATVWLRAALIGTILFIIFLTWFVKWRRRRKAAKALEDELIKEPVGDGAVLAERMHEALAKLKKSGGKSYLYDLPWYIVIGPPGVGKTTALRNSGIEFPGSEGLADAVEGFGGTRNCDWWFAEDAVLIDTAGRYTTQDSDAEADKASWAAFLDILKRGRPNQPINGVVLAFSVEDMMTSDPDSLAQNAQQVRERLSEIHEVLKIDFPVYVLFTKADLIAGFREYFSSFSVSRRKAVWGTTFQTRDRAEQTHPQVAAEFDRLISRLSDEVIDRMSEEPDGISRIAIFGLPGQMALLRSNIDEFLRRVFEPTRYKTNAILRGFYFTSGTQEGTPIDQVLGAIARNQDQGASFQPAFMSGKGKSYFLHDLLKKVIFEESDWVSHDARAVRRSAALRTLAVSLITVVTLGAMGAFGWSFWQNASLLQTAQAEANRYAGNAQNEIRREIIDETNPSLIMAHLQDLRLMAAGYGQTEQPSFLQGLGLGQFRRINLASTQAYSDALERMLRPRMILHMENTIPQLVADGDTAGIYRALKVYILLGGQQDGPPDDDAIKAFFADVWAEQFSSAGQFDERDQLDNHLAAMLELDDRLSPSISIDSEIVADAREAVVNLPLAEQAYASIKDRSLNSEVLPFNLVERIGGRVERAFQTKSEIDLAELGVPALFTFQGYWGFFLEELGTARKRLVDDQWVLGDVAARVGYEAQLASLESELHRLYQGDFEDAWNGMLNQIAIGPMSNDAPSFDGLAILASSVNSPLLELAEAVEEETRLLRLYDAIEGMTPADLASGGLGDKLGNAAFNRMYSQSGTFQRVLLSWLQDGQKSQERAGPAREDTQRRQVERITDAFKDWHVLLRGETGARPMDALLRSVADLRENRRLAANSPTPADDTLLQQRLSALTVNNTSLPQPMAALMSGIENEFRTVAQDATMAQLNRAMNEEITQFCEQFIGPLFPFGNGRHVASNVFGEFFGPGGRMDKFYATRLQPHVTRTPDGLRPVPNSPIGSRLSANTLRQFDRAEAIRAAFFASGSADPVVSMFVSYESSSSLVLLSHFTFNGKQIRSRRDDPPAAVIWPGEGSGVVIELFPSAQGRNSRLEFTDGRWAVVDFLRKGRTRVEGNTAIVTHEVGGRSITYRIEFDSTTVPFLMPELSQFSCPISLE